MKVHKAVIAAAGLGTRMFPITKTIDKAMLPIGSRPAIELIVGECRAAGVDQIAVVVRAGSSQVQDYYTPDPILESLLARHSWQSKGVVLNDIGRGIDFQFFYQRLDVDDYGTAVPLLLVADFVGEESFYYISGDDVLIDAPSTSTLRNLAEQVEAGGSGVGGARRKNTQGAEGLRRIRASHPSLGPLHLRHPPPDQERSVGRRRMDLGLRRRHPLRARARALPPATGTRRPSRRRAAALVQQAHRSALPLPATPAIVRGAQGFPTDPRCHRLTARLATHSSRGRSL
jgi:hypothetical protein